MLVVILVGLLAGQGLAVDVPVTVRNHWTGGFQGSFCLPFTQDVSSWRARLKFSQSINSIEIWLAKVESQSTDGREFVLVNTAFNGNEHPGDKLCVTFLGHTTGDISPTATVTMNEPTPATTVPTTPTTPTTTRTLGPGERDISPTTTVTVNEPTPATTSSTTPTTTRTLGPEETWPPTTPPPPTTVSPGIKLPFVLIQSHSGQWEGQFCVDPKTDIGGWELDITFNVGVSGITQWEGDIIGSSSGCSKTWKIVNKNTKGFHSAGTHYCVRMMGKVCSGTGDPHGTAILVDMSRDTQTVPPIPVVTGAQATKYNYGEILMKSILFYEAQRSGKLPPDNRIPWRGDSALTDKGANGEDLTGGWYDAGDNIKFNFPMAFSTTLLTWSLIRYPDAYNRTGQLDEMYKCIKWPLDYFIKCHTAPNVLYAQVGNPAQDHGSWTSPERMTGARTASKIDASHPGSDLAMETAAAMAAGSIAFKHEDPAYSTKLLTHAKQLFEFGKAHQGKYSSSVPGATGFYTSQDYEDENSWGGVWLHKATGEQKYLDYAEQHFVNKTAWGFSWDEKIGGANLLLYEATKKNEYKQTILGTFHDWFPGGSVPYTPKCLAFRLQWGSLRYAANTAYLALVAADDGINTDTYRKWGMTQLNYAFGDTGRSYIVGFGVNPPKKPHHRASSCPNLPAPCGWSSQIQPGPNPHTLYGAMVGGPGRTDNYIDDRKDYTKNEVACDYNAGMQASTAALEHLALLHQLPAHYKSICP